MQVLIAVTHLLGSGHLARALTLARAFKGSGHSVIVVSGGMPVPQLDGGDIALWQLPPLRSDGVDFTTLLDAEGRVADAAVTAARQTALLEALHSTQPDVVITELFPFGRRILQAEFTALLEAAHALPRRPIIAASIRDILAPPSKPAKAALADRLVDQFYDMVLVHADCDVTPLELSWPVSPMLADKLRYTGFVAPPAPMPHPETTGAGEVIVSAGGGNVGENLFLSALAAARAMPEQPWRILIGGSDAAARSAALSKDAPANAIVEPARPDFRQMLHHAAASVSMCGYNTALDLLQTACPAVLVPFDAGQEVEQGLRADALAKLDGITVLRNADLGTESLIAALRDIRRAPKRAALRDGFDGAARTVAVVTELSLARP